MANIQYQQKSSNSFRKSAERVHKGHTNLQEMRQGRDMFRLS